VVAAGTPEDVAGTDTHTARFLRQTLAEPSRPAANRSSA